MFLWWSSTRLFKPHGFLKKHGRQGAGLIFPISLYIYIENFKNLFVRNLRADFNITWQKCFLGGPLPSRHDLSKNMAARGRGLFSLYIIIENLKKSSCQKPLDRFQYNLAEMFPWWPFTKIVQAVIVCQKTWPLVGADLIFLIYLYRNL